MLKFGWLAFISLLVGCGGGQRVNDALTPAGGPGNWFCQSSLEPEQWECVQDPTLAENPEPTRLPSDVAAVRDVEPATGGALPPALNPELQIGDATASTDPAAALAGSPTSEPDADADADADADDTEDAAAEPAPHNPVLQAPAEHFVVQLIAMSSARQLADFVAEHQLQALPSVRVERSGELFHVLLLGVFESFEQAEQASTTVPSPFASDDAWIRPVGALQAAILRGDAIASQAAR